MKNKLIVAILLWMASTNCLAQELTVPMGTVSDGESDTEVVFAGKGSRLGPMPVKVSLDANSQFADCTALAEVLPDPATQRFLVRLERISCAGTDSNGAWSAEGSIRGFAVERGGFTLGIPFPYTASSGEVTFSRKTRLSFIIQETASLYKKNDPPVKGLQQVTESSERQHEPESN